MLIDTKAMCFCQDEKLSTLNTHGDKLLQQNHVESQRIADELQAINARRKKVTQHFICCLQILLTI